MSRLWVQLQCDRCNKKYRRNEHVSASYGLGWLNLKSEGFSGSDGSFFTRDTDLCGDCGDSLKEWYDNPKQD